MKRGVIIILSGVLLGLLGAGGYFYYLRTQVKKETATSSTKTSEKIAIAYASWKDPLGVTFSYPQDAVVNKHDEDKENYMHVEITSATYSGRLVLWAKDFPKGVTDLSSWAKKETASGTGVIVDTMVGGVEAKKILIGADSVRVGIVYDGLLFEIEGSFDPKGYWNDVLDTVLSSYVFYPVEGKSPVTVGSPVGIGESDGAVEEEVLE
ncbi:MAG: hypothetical protein AAB492_01035 [Patescibacteria group bacterium]|mgnify:FL=1